MKKIKKTTTQLMHKTKPDTTPYNISLHVTGKEDLQYQHLVDHSPHILFIHQDGKIVYANLRAEKDLGHAKTSLIGKGIKDLVSFEFQEIVEENINNVLSGQQEKHRREIKLTSLDGREIYIESTGTKVNFNGKAAVMVTGQDITDKKKLQAELEESEVS